MTKLNWEEFGRALDKAIAEEAGAAAKEIIDRLRLQFPEKFLGKAEPEKPEWCNCHLVWDAPYSNDGEFGRDDERYPRLAKFVKGRRGGAERTRAGFQTEADAQLFLDALPEEEK